MSNLWHFGSSYSFCGNDEIVFSHHMAKEYQLEFKHKAVKGSSNYMIFLEILQNELEFEKNDILLINWTWLSRGEYIDGTGKLKSTNFFIKENNSELINPPDKNELNLDWILNWNFDWNIKLFIHTINKYFYNLRKKGIKIYNVWFHDDLLYQNGITKNSELIKNNFPYILDFAPCYLKWLENKNWLKTDLNKHDSGHYKNNIQIDLANEYMNKINDLNQKII